jgi:xyloglucan:xyloglucosyl transferase
MVRSRALLLLVVAGLAAANFLDDCDIPWQPQNAWFSDDGNSLSMQLVSNYSGRVLDLVAFPLADRWLNPY